MAYGEDDGQSSGGANLAASSVRDRSRLAGSGAVEPDLARVPRTAGTPGPSQLTLTLGRRADEPLVSDYSKIWPLTIPIFLPFDPPAMDDLGEFDFGSWCCVCDRAIAPPPTEPPDAPSASTSTAQQVTPPIASGGTSSKSRKHAAGGGAGAGAGGGGGATRPGLAHRRNKSGTKLHHAGGRHGHHRSSSHTSLQGLAPSTPIIPTPPTPPLTDPDQSAALSPPSSLYCSEECRRIDEMRSRLAFADLGPSASNTSVGIRRSSSSASSSAAYGSFGGASPVPTLDFSTRRNSRGAEGGYSFRPSLMQRLPSEQEQAGLMGPPTLPYSRSRSRSSTDSLVSLGDGEDKGERPGSGSGSFRPPSALSSLRRMTPISANSSSSLPLISETTTKTRPRAISRSATDVPRPTSLRTESGGSSNGVADGQDKEERLISPVKAINAPPPPSPGVLQRPVSHSLGNIQAITPNADNSTARPSNMIRMSSSVRSSRPPRSSSSASLALMGTSLGKSYQEASWSVPKRSESTASLSGLIATGEMIPLSESLGHPPIPTTQRRSSAPRPSTSPSSPSSISSFAHSHSSALSSQRSTAGSSDHPDQRKEYDAFYRSGDKAASTSSLANGYLSSSAGSQVPSQATSKLHPRRPTQGLLMTPSTSSLSTGDGSSYGESVDGTAKPRERRHHSKRRGSTTERTPTQSLSKNTNLQRNGSSTNLIIGSGINGSGSDPALHAMSPPAVDRVKRRSAETRSMSNPVTAKRPQAGELGLTTPSKPRSSVGSPPSPGPGTGLPVNAAGVNPSLSYLYPQNSGSPGKMAPPSRNWSWDHLPVPQYQALDVDKVRRETSERNLKALGQDELAEQVRLAPGPPPKERKRLFYFSEAD
ncbi:hypothetical protein MNV49_002472 [Pseudohyphozyma bogoriensis]|nr:hypothetical protein MNV49_002472 [Pseudohyphozyma bogoriensis]